MNWRMHAAKTSKASPASISAASIERRPLLRATIGGTVGLCATATTAFTQTKLVQIKASQSAAGYQNHPSGNQRCGDCNNFVPPKQCKLISGPINVQGWCRLYAPASGRVQSGV